MIIFIYIISMCLILTYPIGKSKLKKNKYIGDDYSVAEELLHENDNDNDNHKFEIVYESVANRYLTLDEATSIYKVNMKKYKKWLYEKTKKENQNS